jgi:hypothetical protein
MVPAAGFQPLEIPTRLKACYSLETQAHNAAAALIC